MHEPPCPLSQKPLTIDWEHWQKNRSFEDNASPWLRYAVVHTPFPQSRGHEVGIVNDGVGSGVVVGGRCDVVTGLDIVRVNDCSAEDESLVDFENDTDLDAFTDIDCDGSSDSVNVRVKDTVCDLLKGKVAVRENVRVGVGRNDNDGDGK